jgi:hypothetical protein
MNKLRNKNSGNKKVKEFHFVHKLIHHLTQGNQYVLHHAEVVEVVAIVVVVVDEVDVVEVHNIHKIIQHKVAQ